MNKTDIDKDGTKAEKLLEWGYSTIAFDLSMDILTDLLYPEICRKKTKILHAIGHHEGILSLLQNDIK